MSTLYVRGSSFNDYLAGTVSTLYVRGSSFNDYLAGTASTVYVRGLSGHRHHPGSCSEAHWGRRETEGIGQNIVARYMICVPIMTCFCQMERQSKQQFC